MARLVSEGRVIAVVELGEEARMGSGVVGVVIDLSGAFEGVTVVVVLFIFSIS